MYPLVLDTALWLPAQKHLCLVSCQSISPTSVCRVSDLHLTSLVRSSVNWINMCDNYPEPSYLVSQLARPPPNHLYHPSPFQVSVYLLDILVITKTWRSGVILLKVLSKESIEGFSACSVADVGSSIPATQRKGDNRHNENKELLGSTLAKEIGNRHRRAKTTRIKM